MNEASLIFVLTCLEKQTHVFPDDLRSLFHIVPVGQQHILELSHLLIYIEAGRFSPVKSGEQQQAFSKFYSSQTDLLDFMRVKSENLECK